MTAPKIITFTTDFGLTDSYVGQMKGAVLAVEPGVRLVDLCHDVPSQDVASGAYILETGFDAFPDGTVHVAVVDPGVGTSRRAVVVRTRRFYFVAPDNGLLSRVLDREAPLGCHVVQEPRFRGPRRSATFEGRDVLAPAAAWICRDVDPAEFGPPAGPLVRLECRRDPLQAGRATEARVLHVDRFGNAAVDVSLDALVAALGAAPDERSPLALEAPGGVVRSFRRTYGDAETDEPFLLINSADYLEVALARGNAADRLGLRTGTRVRLTAGRGAREGGRPEFP